MYKLISYYMRKINPVTAANKFENSLVSTSEATSDTDLFDMIILKLLENVNFLVLNFIIILLQVLIFLSFCCIFLLERDIAWELDPVVYISFIYEYLTDVGLFLLYQILFLFNKQIYFIDLWIAPDNANRKRLFRAFLAIEPI